MDLKKFVIKTMRDLDGAVSESSSVAGIRGIVHFDVAVVANEKIGVDGEVQVIGIAKGKIDGNLSNQVTTRIEFNIQTKKAISPAGNSG